MIRIVQAIEDHDAAAGNVGHDVAKVLIRAGFGAIAVHDDQVKPQRRMLVRQAQVREQRVTVALVEVRVAAMSDRLKLPADDHGTDIAGAVTRLPAIHQVQLDFQRRAGDCRRAEAAARSDLDGSSRPKEVGGGVGDRDRVDRLIGRPGGQSLLVLLQPCVIDRVVIEALKRCDQPPARFRLPSVGNDIRWQDQFARWQRARLV